MPSPTPAGRRPPSSTSPRLPAWSPLGTYLARSGHLGARPRRRQRTEPDDRPGRRRRHAVLARGHRPVGPDVGVGGPRQRPRDRALDRGHGQRQPGHELHRDGLTIGRDGDGVGLGHVGDHHGAAQRDGLHLHGDGDQRRRRRSGVDPVGRRPAVVLLAPRPGDAHPDPRHALRHDGPTPSAPRSPPAPPSPSRSPAPPAHPSPPERRPPRSTSRPPRRRRPASSAPTPPPPRAARPPTSPPARPSPTSSSAASPRPAP